MRPLPETRFFNMFPGLLLSVVCLMALTDEQPADWLPAEWVLWSGVALGMVLAIRGFRMGVVVDGSRITVRGMFKSRTVPAKAIVAVSGGKVPMVHWRSPSRKARSSPLLAFADALGAMPRYSQYNRQSLRQVRRAISEARET